MRLYFDTSFRPKQIKEKKTFRLGKITSDVRFWKPKKKNTNSFLLIRYNKIKIFKSNENGSPPSKCFILCYLVSYDAGYPCCDTEKFHFVASFMSITVTVTWYKRQARALTWRNLKRVKVIAFRKLTGSLYPQGTAKNRNSTTLMRFLDAFRPYGEEISREIQDRAGFIMCK